MTARRTIPMKDIRSIAKRIAKQFDVEKIILFGSYAYGKPDENSDVDLLVVMNTAERPIRQRLAIYQSLSPIRIALDIIVRREDEILRRIPQGDFFLQDAWEKGKLLYAK